MEHELTGPVGYIPGANWFPRTEVAKMIEAFPDDALIAVVCMNDSESRDVVRQLQAAGKKFAAIVAGGMRSWKLMGFSTSRHPTIFNRRCVRISKVSSERVPCPTNKRGRRQVSLGMVTDHIGDGSHIQWLKMAAFMVHGRLSCVDGRDDCGVIGTPGGDMGEFIMSLSVAEELLNRDLKEEEIASLFQRRLDAFGRFYMHTDQTSLDRLMAAIYSDPFLKSRIKPVDSHFALNTLMHQLPVDCRSQVIDLLLNPDYIGCGHLRLLIQKGDQYKARDELVRTALKCFYYALWDGATECDYVVLSGLHEECGVASVSLENEVHSFTRIPLIPPTIQGNQMFVAHQQISTYLRNQQAEWILAQDDILPFSKTTAVAFHALVNLRADLHSNLTLSALASDLPLYSLRFSDTGYCDVTYQGIINSPEDDVELEETNLRLSARSTNSPTESSEFAPNASQMAASLNQMHTSDDVNAKENTSGNTHAHHHHHANCSHHSHSHAYAHLQPLGHADQGLGIEHISTRPPRAEKGEARKSVGEGTTIHIDIPHNQHHFGHSHAHPEPSQQNLIYKPLTFKLSEFWSNMKRVSHGSGIPQTIPEDIERQREQDKKAVGAKKKAQNQSQSPEKNQQVNQKM